MASGRERLRDDVVAEVARRGPRWLLGALEPDRKTKPQGGDNISTLCWWHDERDPSCSLHRAADTGHVAASCKSCGAGSDCLGIAAAAWNLDAKEDFARVLDDVARLVGLDPERYQDEPRARGATTRPSAPTPEKKATAAPNREVVWRQLVDLDPDGWEFLHERGIDAAAPLCRSVPPSGGPKPLYGMNLAVPLRDVDGRIVAIQARTLSNEVDPATGKSVHDFRVDGQSKAGVFGEPQRLKLDSVEWAILAEGLTDYLAAASAVGPDNPRAVVLGVAGVNNADYVKQLPLAKKRVVFAFDADEEGDRCTNELFAAVTAQGASGYRARPIAGCKDLCDMVAAGQDLAAFLRRPKAIRRYRPNVKSVVASGALEGSPARHAAKWKRGIPITIEFLDRAFGGLFPTDLLLVGSETGVGKTEILCAIAAAIAQCGRRVRYFALEAYENEITDRLKYRELLRIAFPALHRAGVEPYFDDYVNGHPVLQELFAPYDAEVNALLKPTLDNLFVEYRMRNFTVEDFVAIAEDTELETDVFILDHLHYVDSPDDNENKGLTKILQSISDVAQRLGKAVLLAAHVRKNVDPRKRRVIPRLEDFQGTSNIPKIVTKALMLARVPPDMVPPSMFPYLRPTFMEVQKYRQDGGRTGSLAVVEFNLKTGRYADTFQLGRIEGEKFEAMTIADWPHWAKRPLIRAGRSHPRPRPPAHRGEKPDGTEDQQHEVDRDAHGGRMKPVAIVSAWDRVHTVRWPHYVETWHANTARAEALAKAYAAGKVKRVVVCHTSTPAPVLRVLRKHGVQPLSWGDDVQRLASSLPDLLARSGFVPPPVEQPVEAQATQLEHAPPPEPTPLAEPKPTAPRIAGAAPPTRPREWDEEDIAAILEAVRYADGDGDRFLEGYHLQREKTRPPLQLYSKLVEVGAQRGLDLDPALLRGLRIRAGLESPPTAPIAAPPPTVAPAVDPKAIAEAAAREAVRAVQATTAKPPGRPRARQPMIVEERIDDDELPSDPAPPSARSERAPEPLTRAPRNEGLRRLRVEVQEAVRTGALSKATAFDVLSLIDAEPTR